MKKLIGIALLTIVVFTSCTKEGPAGPAGATGNANVLPGSNTISPANWSWDGVNNKWYCNITFTKAISDQSAVLFYVITNSGGASPMPYTDNNGTIITFENFLYNTPSTIRIDYYNGTANLTQPSINYYIEYVIIPPALKALHQNVNYNNYEEVKHIFNVGNYSSTK